MSTGLSHVKPLQQAGIRVRAGLVYAAVLLGTALFSSGTAGLVNQVVWQRSLKVFLGGSETISSMVVVLVFMGGLGVGSIWMGQRARRLRNPLKTVSGLEAVLGLINLAIAWLLSTELSASVFAFQKVALSLGLPLPLTYILGATVTLLVPCFLMGATMPLAAEVCQRHLGLTHSRLLGLLFFINTFGSVAGTILASGLMISHLGLTWSLIIAASLNILAAVLLWFLSRRYPPLASVPHSAAGAGDVGSQRRALEPTVEELLALGLGFCSLGYEMYLFRLIPLRHQPLPFTFAAVLTGFLLFWSVGAALSSRSRRLSISTALRLCGMATALSIPMFVIDKQWLIQGSATLAGFVLLKSPYFMPCVFFGYLFGLVASRAARSWGRDIGRIYGFNTAGSCLGVIFMTLIGYEIPFYVMVLVIALLLFAMQEHFDACEGRRGHAAGQRGRRWIVPALSAGAAVCMGLTVDLSRVTPNMRLYFGRDGVIGIDGEGNMLWDGLWHSALAENGNHVGTNNWYLATCPIFCHAHTEVKDVCVIGVATGITAATLAKLGSVERVDGYDINRTLKRIYRLYPEGTLNVAANPKINLIWQDARSGLSLNARKYDVIQAQPLYLKQAGSALLNSVEFYELVSTRLKPGGVFCLYSNGTPEQAFAVRQTAAEAFAHHVSFFDGYLLICSNDPIDISEDVLRRRLASNDPLWKEIHGWHETRDAVSILSHLDIPPLPWGDGRLITSDDHPIVEYPQFLSQQVNQLGYGDILPVPGQIY